MTSSAIETAIILGTKESVGSWIWVAAWNSEISEADQQRGQQDGGGDLGGQHHRLRGDVGDVGVGHAATPTLCRSRTRAVVIRPQPSTTTNSSSLNGSETIAGGTIIMPIDISAALTSMSITRNGMKTTSPMMKALLSSESTNAGISVVS